MALPLPNQSSSSTGPDSQKPPPLPITALPACLSSTYLDFLVDHAIEAAVRLPRTDEDVLLHCEPSPLFLDPPLLAFGLHGRSSALGGDPMVGVGEADPSGGMEEGQVLEVDVQSNSRRTKRSLAASEGTTCSHGFKAQKTEGPARASASVPLSKAMRKNEGCRRREGQYLAESGRLVLPQMRNKISTLVSSENLTISILGRLVDGTQLGGYQPKVVKMEKAMERLTEQMLSASLRRVACPAAKVMSGFKAMGYRTLSWDGKFLPYVLMVVMICCHRH